MRLVGVGVLVAALVALAAGRADAGSMYVHSARSGTFAGGRLTLHGVGRNVTWATTGGDTGVAPITLARKRLFMHGRSATGVLDIAGRRRGKRFALRLSALRYNAARGTASYRATRLTKRAGAAQAAAAVPWRFRAASLSVVPGSSLGTSLGASPPGASPVASGDNGGHDCEMNVANETDEAPGHRIQANPIQLVSSQQWDTDNWDSAPSTAIIQYDQASDFSSDGGLWRGCEQSTVWHFVPACIVGQGCGPSGTFTFKVEWDWNWVAPTYSCTSSNPQFKCVDMTDGGVINWWLEPASATGG